MPHIGLYPFQMDQTPSTLVRGVQFFDQVGRGEDYAEWGPKLMGRCADELGLQFTQIPFLDKVSEHSCLVPFSVGYIEKDKKCQGGLSIFNGQRCGVHHIVSI